MLRGAASAHRLTGALAGPDAASRPADGKTQNFRIRTTTAAVFSSSSQTRPRSQHLPRSHQVGGGHDDTPDAVDHRDGPEPEYERTDEHCGDGNPHGPPRP